MKKTLLILILLLITKEILCQYNWVKIYNSPFYGISNFYSYKINTSNQNALCLMLGMNYTNPNESGRILRLNKNNGAWVIPANGFLNPYWCLAIPPYPNPPYYSCNYVREFKVSPIDTGFLMKNSEVYCGGYESGNLFFVTHNSGIDTSLIQQFSQDMLGQICIGFDINPVNDSILYVCYPLAPTYGSRKIFKSTNRGTNWFITDSINIYTTQTSLLKINPLNPSYIYICGSAYYMSTNSGYNFFQLNAPIFKSMYFDQSDGSIYTLALADSSLYKSINSGLNWVRLFTFSERPASFEISPDNHNILYAGTPKGLYRSINSGVSWTLYNNSFSPSKNVIGISKDPGTGESLFVCTSDAVYKVWGSYIQTIDTSFIQYMPLAIGNAWVYQHDGNWPPPFGTHYVYKTTITKDTLINGKRYFNCTLPLGPLTNIWNRVDSMSGLLLSYDSTFNCTLHQNEFTVDSLASKLHDSAKSCIQGNMPFRICIDTNSINFPAGFNRTGLGFNSYQLSDTYRKYLKGIGIYQAHYGEIDPLTYTLRGCVINGIVYGDTSMYYSVSGYVTYSDNNQPVQSGYVKALKYDYINDKIIAVDSTSINSNGYYSLSWCPQDSLDIMAYGDDEEDFVPTYHDTTIYWQHSLTVYPSSNLNNINIKVHRINNDNPGNSFISGGVYRALMIPNDALKDAVVYAKYNGQFRRAGITIANGYYIVDSLPSGTCELIADRIGYYSDYKTLQVGQIVLDTINFFLTRVTGITKESSSSIPTSFKLHQNYPNPFNPLTTLKIDVPPIHNNPPARSGGKGVFVSVTVYDILGREVAVLLEQDMTPGTYTIIWNATNYASGLYFYKMTAGDFTDTKKMVLIK